MIRLYDLSDKELSKGIKNLSPILYNGIKIENQLLDGSMHTQTIGDAQKYMTFELLSNHNQVDDINFASSQGAKLKIVIDDKYYIGFCEVSEWQRITIRYLDELNRWYTSSARFVVSKEGTI